MILLHSKLIFFCQGDDSFTKNLDQFVCVIIPYLKYHQTLLRVAASRQHIFVINHEYVGRGIPEQIGSLVLLVYRSISLYDEFNM